MDLPVSEARWAVVQEVILGRKITYLAGLSWEAQNIGRFSINLGGSGQADLGSQGWIWDSWILGIALFLTFGN